MGQAESRQEQFWEACGFGHADKVEQFISEGVDVNWVSKTHDSCPVHVASQGKPRILDMLIQAGCDVNARDERACTALHHAAMNGYLDCARLLVDAGAIVNVQDKNKWTPLHCASYYGYPRVVELLINRKADVNLVNKDNRTALQEVARSRNGDESAVGKAASLLIAAGSDVEARSGAEGFGDFTVLMLASYHGHVAVVRHLLLARCEVNAQSSNDWTALHWAADRSHLNIVELLLENDADPYLLGSRSELAKDRAVSDDVKAVFERYAYLNSAPPDEKASRALPTEVSGDNLPDMADFPEHLQAPDNSHCMEEAVLNQKTAAAPGADDEKAKLDQPAGETPEKPLSSEGPNTGGVSEQGAPARQEDHRGAPAKCVNEQKPPTGEATSDELPTGRATESQPAAGVINEAESRETATEEESPSTDVKEKPLIGEATEEEPYGEVAEEKLTHDECAEVKPPISKAGERLPCTEATQEPPTEETPPEKLPSEKSGGEKLPASVDAGE